MERKQRTVFQLDTPYSRVQWPAIAPDDQDTILELLCRLLSPIGQHRSQSVVPSRGKRNKKRKRQESSPASNTANPDATSVPAPEIAKSVLVGLRGITRVLEHLAKLSRPAVLLPQDGIEQSSSENASAGLTEQPTQIEKRQIAAIFVTRSSQPSVLHDHLPVLIAAASQAPGASSIRLVQLPKGCEERVCKSLGLSSAAFVALYDGAPYATALMQLVLDKVPEVSVPWIKETRSAEFLPLKVNAIVTSHPVIKKPPKKV